LYPSFRARFPELKDVDPIIQIILLFLGDISLIGIMSNILTGLPDLLKAAFLPALLRVHKNISSRIITQVVIKQRRDWLLVTGD
jgi:hypothetical protein